MKKKVKEIKEIEVLETDSQTVEVFGTTEVSVKEFMGSSDKSLVLLSNYDLAKKNLIALKEKHEARVEVLVLIDKLTPAELKELNTIRGELREPRYLVQKIEKNNISVFEAYKKTDKSNLKDLIDINKELEDKADEKIKVEELRKKNEQEEEKAAEALRVKTINDKIKEIETSCYEIIQKMTFSEIDFSKTQLFAFFTVDFNFEEYDILFDQAKSRVEVALKNKVISLTASENQRLDNIRLEEETAELKRLSDLQAERLTAIMPYVAFGQVVDLTKLSELTKGEWEVIFEAKKALFDADSVAKEKTRKEEEASLKAEKQKINGFRIERMRELGFEINDKDVYIHADLFVGIALESIFESNNIEFETIIKDAKTSIANSQKEKQESEEKEIAKEEETKLRVAKLLEAGLKHSEEHDTYFVAADCDFILLIEDISNETHEEFEETLSEVKKSISDYNLSIADAANLKAENKARVKKYSKDKKALTEFVKSLEFRNAVPELENDNLQPVLDKILLELENSRGFLLTEINIF